MEAPDADRFEKTNAAQRTRNSANQPRANSQRIISQRRATICDKGADKLAKTL